MKGRKPDPIGNVIPMRGDTARPVPAAPEFMSEQARAVWRELAPDLVQKDRLQPAYTYQFSAYCESVSNFLQATAVIAVDGFWFETKTRNGLQQKKTAAWGAQQEAMNAMRRDSALFGLSPVDEARLKGGGQGDLFADMMEQLKNGSA
jgi:P27 family predicted phage terminase small subunit